MWVFRLERFQSLVLRVFALGRIERECRPEELSLQALIILLALDERLNNLPPVSSSSFVELNYSAQPFEGDNCGSKGGCEWLKWLTRTR